MRAMGGIASVLATYQATGLFNRWPTNVLTTFEEGPAWRRLATSAWAYGKLISMLATNRVGFVHLHVAQKTSFIRKSIFLFTARAFGCPTVLHIHGAQFDAYYAGSNSILRPYIEWTLNSSTYVIALSQYWNNWLQKHAGHNRIVTIHNPVLAPDRPLRSEAPVETPPLILFLGRIGQRKGAYDLINAAGRLRDLGVQCHVTLCGDGEIASASALLRKLNLEDMVTVRDWVGPDAKRDLFERATAFVLPSYHEGLPMAILEAMAAGLPVVSTTVGGIPEAITDGIEGLLVSPGDVERLALALRFVIENPAHASRMGASARDKVETTFEASQAMKPLTSLYEELARLRGISESPQSNSR